MNSYVNKLHLASEQFFNRVNNLHSVKFWEDIIANKEEYVIINGSCYFIEDENDKETKGFDGYLFVILMNSGKEIKTTNLWCKGKIPQEYREFLQDNAKFV